MSDRNVRPNFGDLPVEVYLHVAVFLSGINEQDDGNWEDIKERWADVHGFLEAIGVQKGRPNKHSVLTEWWEEQQEEYTRELEFMKGILRKEWKDESHSCHGPSHDIDSYYYGMLDRLHAIMDAIRNGNGTYAVKRT